MPLTAQQWSTLTIINNFLQDLLNTQDIASGWTEYQVWAAANSGYVPTDAELAIWQALTPTDEIPAECVATITSFYRFAAHVHNEAVA